MFNSENESITRIKTGVVLILSMLVLGYIDSYFLFLVSIWNYVSNFNFRIKKTLCIKK